MQTFSTILTYTLPFLVVGYIIWDLSVSKYTVKSPERILNKNEIERKYSEMSRDGRGGNDGKFFSRKEILRNAEYIITNMF